MRLLRETSTLQEVGLLLLWLISTLRAMSLCLAPREMFGCILNYGNVAPLSSPTRLADPNRFRDAYLILFVYFSFVFFFFFL